MVSYDDSMCYSKWRYIFYVTPLLNGDEKMADENPNDDVKKTESSEESTNKENEESKTPEPIEREWLENLINALGDRIESKISDIAADVEAAAGGNQDKEDSKDKEDSEDKTEDNDVDEDTLSEDVKDWNFD